MSALVVAFVDDLMFLSRIQEAARRQGVVVQSARQIPQLQAALQNNPRLVLLDLESPRLDIEGALAELVTRKDVDVLGFFSHVDVEKARVAQARGCRRVLPRSAFVQKLDGILLEAAVQAAPNPPEDPNKNTSS